MSRITLDGSTSEKAPRIITLGTAGGPRWWPANRQSPRHGIATAVVVEDGYYLIDCGVGVGRQLARAGLSLTDLRGVFITHLHSDHVVDLSSILLFGMSATMRRPSRVIPIIGPGNRGALPPLSPRSAVEPRLPNSDNPTPGTVELVSMLIRAYGTDIADRVRDALRPAPDEVFAAQDITIPDEVAYDPNATWHPRMRPFSIWEDDQVHVTATLVNHPPLAPAFAFRFDTEGGSVVISGDTAPSENLIELASGADTLLHEAIDFDAVERNYDLASTEIRDATMDHHRKSHTSAAQAVMLAEAAGVSTLVLHHLVPGDVDEATWREKAGEFSGELIIAEDLGTIPVRPANVSLIG